MAITATVQKWGDSLGVFIPKELVVEESISEGDTVNLTIEKSGDLSPFFGKCTHRETSTQEFKDELCQVWSN